MFGLRGWLAVTAAGILLSLGAAVRAPAASPADERAMLDRGRVLTAFGSCNDCHTPGWRESDGKLPVSQWMTGNTIGFRGPWGTIYPTNVRLRFAQMSEADWLQAVATRGGHPPMKWTDLRALSITDRKAIYRFIRSLGPAGAPAPSDVPPDKEPGTPYINVIPQ